MSSKGSSQRDGEFSRQHLNLRACQSNLSRSRWIHLRKMTVRIGNCRESTEKEDVMWKMWNAATLRLTDQIERGRVNLEEMNDKKTEMKREIHLAKIREVRMNCTCLNLQWRKNFIMMSSGGTSCSSNSTQSRNEPSFKWQTERRNVHFVHLSKKTKTNYLWKSQTFPPHLKWCIYNNITEMTIKTRFGIKWLVYRKYRFKIWF